MFGTLRLRRHGMTRANRRLYHAQFCGVCHALREYGGRPASLLTNYDEAFLYLVYAAMESTEGSLPVEMKPCTALGFVRVPVQILSPRGRRTIAALTVALVHATIADDVRDDGGIFLRVAARAVASRAQRAIETLRVDGFLVEVLATLGERQAAAESDPAPTLMSLSEPTADLLGHIFAWIAESTEQPEHAGALRSLGEALGRFIYVWDAELDFEKDVRGGAFNALQATMGANSSRATVRQFLSTQLDTFRQSVEALPLGESKVLALQLADSLRIRVAQRLAVPSATTVVHWENPSRGRLSRERGFCDSACACDCGAGHCCGADSCSGDCCSGCDCITDCCCWGCGEQDCWGRIRRRDPADYG